MAVRFQRLAFLGPCGAVQANAAGLTEASYTWTGPDVWATIESHECIRQTDFRTLPTDGAISHWFSTYCYTSSYTGSAYAYLRLYNVTEAVEMARIIVPDGYKTNPTQPRTRRVPLIAGTLPTADARLEVQYSIYFGKPADAVMKFLGAAWVMERTP